MVGEPEYATNHKTPEALKAVTETRSCRIYPIYIVCNAACSDMKPNRHAPASRPARVHSREVY